MKKGRLQDGGKKGESGRNVERKNRRKGEGGKDEVKEKKKDRKKDKNRKGVKESLICKKK